MRDGANARLGRWLTANSRGITEVAAAIFLLFLICFCALTLFLAMEVRSSEQNRNDFVNRYFAEMNDRVNSNDTAFYGLVERSSSNSARLRALEGEVDRLREACEF